MAIETLELRVRRLEEERLDNRSDRKEMQAEIEKLGERIDKLTLAIFSAVLTLAVFGLGIAVTLLTTAGG